MKTPREEARWVAHQVLADECSRHDTLGWSHGWRCENVTTAFAAAFAARDAEVRNAALREAGIIADNVSAEFTEGSDLYRVAARIRKGIVALLGKP